MANEGTRGVTPELRHERHESRAGATYKAFLKDLMAASENLDSGILLNLRVIGALEVLVLDESNDRVGMPGRIIRIARRWRLRERGGRKQNQQKKRGSV